MILFDLCAKFFSIELWSVNKTVGCFDPKVKTSCSVSVYFITLHFLTIVESRSSVCVKSTEFAEIMFIVFLDEFVKMLFRS